MFVNEEQKGVANNVSIVDYLLSIGEPIKNEGNNYYRHEEHDSLVVNVKQNYFSWNSKNVSGNAITYLMHVHNMSFIESVVKINEDMGNHNIKKYDASKHIEYPNAFDYTIKEVSRTTDIRDYLVNDRKLDPALVDNLIAEDYIKQDIYKNVVFKWKEGNNLIGANLQGTREIPESKRIHPERQYFKKVLPTTEKHTFDGFNIKIGYPKSLYFFESSIDLLSFLSIFKDRLSNCQLKSMDGLKHQTVLQTINDVKKELRDKNMDIESIDLCVDNDAAGMEFIKKLNFIRYKRVDGELINVGQQIPNKPEGLEKWDWNNELKNRMKQIEKHKEIEL